ncbi:MAG: hypothetical protein JSU07_06295 [Bacteroidetes bacterium]|nr:hypothetical protein [Bacteroidota bacterium]
MTKLNYSIIVFIAVLFICTACNKKQVECLDQGNPACPNYNPCYKKTNADASFITMEGVGGQGFEADTISCEHAAVFYAKNKLNTGNVLSWRIQSGSYVRNFAPPFPAYNAYSPYFFIGDTVLQFNIYNENNPPTACFYTVTCFSNLNNGSCNIYKTVDSVKKIFYMWPKEFPNGNYTTNPPNTFRYKPIWGTYAGYKQSNPSKLVYVTLFDTVFAAPFTCDINKEGAMLQNGIIKNLAYDNYSSQFQDLINVYFDNEFFNGASSVVFGNSYGSTTPIIKNNSCYGKGSCFNIGYQGYATLDYNNSKKIYINYAFQDTLSMNWISDYFVGYKVN